MKGAKPGVSSWRFPKWQQGPNQHGAGKEPSPREKREKEGQERAPPLGDVPFLLPFLISFSSCSKLSLPCSDHKCHFLKPLETPSPGETPELSTVSSLPINPSGVAW